MNDIEPVVGIMPFTDWAYNAHALTVQMILIKPIFHCDSKLLASGNFALPNAKDSTFALPNAKNTNMLVSLALGDANFLRWPLKFHFLCVDFIRVG